MVHDYEKLKKLEKEEENIMEREKKIFQEVKKHRGSQFSPYKVDHNDSRQWPTLDNSWRYNWRSWRGDWRGRLNSQDS